MRVLQRSILLVTLMLVLGAAGAAQKSLTLGIFPYLSPGKLVEFHSPLRAYLEAHLGHKVDLVTAPDFIDFANRTHKGEFDLILTAPHMGRLAETRDGYQRVVMTSHEVQGVFLARRGSHIKSLADLKGRTIVMAQPVSLMYQMAVAKLRESGLVPGKDITIVNTRTHNNALSAPLRGEGDAALTTKVVWASAPADIRDQLVVIDETPLGGGHMVMASPRMPAAEVARIRKLLLDFNNTDDGKAYLANTGQKGFIKIDDRLMKELDPYTSVFINPSAQNAP